VLSRLMQRFALEAILAADDRPRREACFAACLKLFQAAPSAVHRQSLADGFLEAFAGRDLGQVPAELTKALSEASSKGSDLSVGIKLGDAKAIAEALKVVASDKSAVSSRLALIESLGATPRPAAAPVLLKLLGSPSAPIKRAALLALMQYDEAAIGKEVCNRWHSTLPNEFDLRSIALRLLASRAVWSKSLVAEVAGSRIKPTEVPLDIVQQMRLHQDAELDRALDRYWGKTRATSEEKKQQIDRLTRLVKSGGSQADAGDAKQGKAIFVKNCGTCHTLFGEGGQTGPNLTGYDREKLDFLAVAVVDPSAAIREEFTQFGIAMKDGRVLTGLVDKETPTTVSIRGANNQTTLLNRDDIDEKQALRNSIMPDGLLDKLSDGEIRDLFAYVMSKTPVK
jgi:putative heme-binding domain-containing protein